MEDKNILKKIGDILFYSFMIIILIFTISISKSNKKGEIPSMLGYKFYTVLTGSMSPTINPGSLVIVKDIDSSKIKSGDIITFGNSVNSNVTTHRVKEVINDDGLKFVTKGDANNVEDPNPLNEDLLIGKVVYFIPIIGATLSFIQENILLLWGLIAFILAVNFIPSSKKESVNAQVDINSK